MKKIKFISPSLFLIIFICFLLPFFSVSCGGGKMMTFNGCSLVLGTKIDYGYGQVQKVAPDFNAILLWVCLFLGFILSFFTVRKIRIAKFIVTGCGFLLLLILMIRLGQDVREQGMFFTASLEFGIYAVFLFLLITLIWSFIEIIKKEPIPPAIESPPSRNQNLCPNCKSPINVGDTFCQQCGFNLIQGEKND